MQEKPWLSSLTFVGYYLIAAIDHGLGPKYSFDEFYQGLENGSLLQDLNTKFPNTFDFSIFPPGSDKERSFLEVIRNSAEGIRGRERKKTGVENSGISLFLAAILDAIQHHEWSTP